MWTIPLRDSTRLISRKYSVLVEITHNWGIWPRQALKYPSFASNLWKKEAEKIVYGGYCENPHLTDSEKWMNSFTNLYSRFHPVVLVRHRCLHEAYKSCHKSVILLREWPAELALATRWVQRANTQAIAQRWHHKLQLDLNLWPEV